MRSLKSLGVYLTFALIFAGVDGIPNHIGTPLHDCISCLCYIRTQCFDLSICANYTITYDYWYSAGAPTITTESDVNKETYQECMADDNCVLNTIDKHLEQYPKEDCICDGNFDCRDKLSLFIFGTNCRQVMPNRHGIRYNYCARLKGLPEFDRTVECLDVNL